MPADAGATLALARDAGAAGITVLVAGGDGTVSLVAHGLAPHHGTLGILPLGTANDLARDLGLPADVQQAARLIAQGTIHRMDLASVNGRHFTTVGGLGLVSDSTMIAARLRAGPARRLVRMVGPLVYKLAATAALFRPRISSVARVAWRDPATGAEHARELALHGIFVTNHARCGGGLVIPTGARDDDGLTELALIPRTSRPRLLANLARLSAGRPLAPGVLDVVRTDRAVIETERDQLFVADGEPLASGRRFELLAHRAAISIIR